jgi:hypothetical protein
MKKFYFLLFVILLIFLYSCVSGGTYNQGGASGNSNYYSGTNYYQTPLVVGS